MKLKNARICLNCEEVFEVKTVYFVVNINELLPHQNLNCPACGCKSNILISKFIPTEKGSAAATASAR